MIIPSLCLAGDASSQAIEDQSLKHINQGVNYFNEGEYDAAEGEFQAALKLNPELAMAHYNLGIINYWRGEYKDARKYFEKAIDKNNDEPAYYFNLGLTYFQMGDYRQAINRFRTAAALDSMDAGTYYNLALAYRKNGDHDKAAMAYEKCIELQAKSSNRLQLEPMAEEKPYQKPPEAKSEGQKSESIPKKEPDQKDLYFSKRVQIGFSSGPSFPENYYFKQISSSTDRISYSVFLGMAFPRKSAFLKDFGGDGYGFALKGRFSSKKNASDKWQEYSLAADIRVFENLDRRGRGKFFIEFGPGIYAVTTDIASSKTDNSQYGLEGGAGFDYLVISYVSIFAEGVYAFCYHGERNHTNSSGYVHFGLSLQL